MVLSSNLIQDNINPKPKKDIVLSLTPNQDSEAVNPNPKKGPEFDSYPRYYKAKLYERQ